MAALHSPSCVGHLVGCVLGAGVVSTGEFIHIPLQVLLRDVVERPVVAALEHGPERLHAVDVGLAVNVLAHRVGHRPVVRQPLVGGVVVGEHVSPVSRVLGHEPLQGGGIGRFHDPSRNLIRGPAFHTGHRRLVSRSPSGDPLGPHPGVHVLGLPAEMRLVSLHRPGERLRCRPVALPDPVSHVPCGLLADAQVAVQLHRAGPFDVRVEQVDGDGPLPIAQLRGLHDRPEPHREELAAAPAAVGHRGVLGPGLNVRALAVRTHRAVGPPLGSEPHLSRRLIGELVEQVLERHSGAERFAGGFLLGFGAFLGPLADFLIHL